jgi:hypothetical protein
MPASQDDRITHLLGEQSEKHPEPRKTSQKSSSSKGRLLYSDLPSNENQKRVGKAMPGLVGSILSYSKSKYFISASYFGTLQGCIYFLWDECLVSSFQKLSHYPENHTQYAKHRFSVPCIQKNTLGICTCNKNQKFSAQKDRAKGEKIERRKGNGREKRAGSCTGTRGIQTSSTLSHTAKETAPLVPPTRIIFR